MNRWNLLSLALCAVLFAGCNLAPITPTFTPAPPTATDVPMILATQAGGSDILNATAIPPNPNCPTTPAGWIPYTVEAGDSLGLLAIQTDSTIDELVQGNCMDNADALLIDTVIYVPRQPVVE